MAVTTEAIAGAQTDVSSSRSGISAVFQEPVIERCQTMSLLGVLPNFFFSVRDRCNFVKVKSNRPAIVGMSRANFIYNFERKIRNELKSVRRDKLNGGIIFKYHWQRIADGISLARQHKCLCTLKQLSRMLGKKFEDASKDDLVRLVAKLEQRDVSLWTKRDYKVVLKTFYQWL